MEFTSVPIYIRKLGTGNSFIKLLTPEEEIAELLTEKYHKITQKCHKKDVSYFWKYKLYRKY